MIFNRTIVQFIITLSFLISFTQGCPPGFERFQVFCLPCPPGYFGLNDVCFECPLNQYSNTVGSLRCEHCPNNTISNHNHTYCLNCTEEIFFPGFKKLYDPYRFEYVIRTSVYLSQNLYSHIVNQGFLTNGFSRWVIMEKGGSTIINSKRCYGRSYQDIKFYDGNLLVIFDEINCPNVVFQTLYTEYGDHTFNLGGCMTKNKETDTWDLFQSDIGCTPSKINGDVITVTNLCESYGEMRISYFGGQVTVKCYKGDNVVHFSKKYFTIPGSNYYFYVAYHLTMTYRN